MSKPEETTNSHTTSATVCRIYRVAMKLGENYVTIEETITLPVTATDDDIAQATELGLRIYNAQHEAIQAQTARIREEYYRRSVHGARHPDAPASPRQRLYVSMVQRNLGWDDDDLRLFAEERGVDIVTMTRSQASVIIDKLLMKIEQQESAMEAPDDESATTAVPEP